MKQWMTAWLVSALMLVSSGAAVAATDQEQMLGDATDVVRQFVDIPENAIPPALLGQAYGIAVIPSVLKIGFVFGGRRGSGVLSVRTADGSWSNPVFVSLTSGSVGFQIGASSTDVILVFKTQRSIDKIANGQISLGGDAAVAAGPVGRSAAASTNLGFNAEVYSYSRSRGLFAGVSLEGGLINIDKESDWLFYDKTGLDALTILRSSDESRMPQAGQRFIYTLDRYMPASDQFDIQSATQGTSMEGEGRGAGTADQYGGGQAQPYDDGGSGVTVEQGNPAGATGSGGAGNPKRNNGQGSGGQGSSQNGGGSGYGSGSNNNY